MPETMIERVARAIWETHDGAKRYPWATLGQDREPYIEYARAAIAAMRPNLEALFREWWKMDCRFGMTETEAVQLLFARIDSALNDLPHIAVTDLPHIAVTAGVRDG